MTKRQIPKPPNAFLAKWHDCLRGMEGGFFVYPSKRAAEAARRDFYEFRRSLRMSLGHPLAAVERDFKIECWVMGGGSRWVVQIKFYRRLDLQGKLEQVLSKPFNQDY